MDADTVSVNESQDEVEEVVEVQQEVVPEETESVEPVEQKEEQRVPVSALQKERKKRQELEYENKFLKENFSKKEQHEPDPDDSYEPITKAQFKKMTFENDRTREEAKWVKDNPEEAELINEKLVDFLKQRPHLVSAVENSPNRYEEAWWMLGKQTAIKPTVKLATPVKKQVPGSPYGVPKAAGLNQTVDIMSMGDKEFNEWRSSARRR